MEKRYYAVSQYLSEQFGGKVYKLALTGGHTCPNRDGTAGFGGCIFCGEGSGSFACDSLEEAIGKLSGKHTENQFIAYFQSFTATYQMSDDLRQRMMDAAGDSRIAVISVATRPDCLDEQAMQLLCELRRKKPVWVELGLQTIHPSSAAFINRGYDLSVFEEAVHRLSARDLQVIVHLILGIPGESRQDMLASVRYMNHLPVQGVKLQLLHVLQQTVLGELYNSRSLPGVEPEAYEKDRFPFTLEEYAQLICDCIRNLRPDMIIHRITGDAPRKDLIAPLWSTDKKRVLNTINRFLSEQQIRQGSALQEP